MKINWWPITVATTTAICFAMMPVMALNGDAVPEQSIPETYVEDVSTENLGLNYGLCAGFEDITDGTCDINDPAYAPVFGGSGGSRIRITPPVTEEAESETETPEEPESPLEPDSLFDWLLQFYERDFTNEPTPTEPEISQPTPSSTVIPSIGTGITNNAEVPPEAEGQVLGVAKEKTPFEIYLASIKRRFENASAYIQSGSPLRTTILLLLLVLVVMTVLVLRVEYQIRKMEIYLSKSERKIKLQMHSAMEKRPGIKIITVKKIRKRSPSLKSKGGSIKVIKNAKARAKFYKINKYKLIK